MITFFESDFCNRAASTQQAVTGQEMSSQTKIDGSEQSNSVVRLSKQLQLGLKLTFSAAVTLFMNPYCKEKNDL